MDACPDFIGVVKIFACLELESRYSGKHFSKVSISRRDHPSTIFRAYGTGRGHRENIIFF
jgi:hypothetical protein